MKLLKQDLGVDIKPGPGNDAPSQTIDPAPAGGALRLPEGKPRSKEGGAGDGLHRMAFSNSWGGCCVLDLTWETKI